MPRLLVMTVGKTHAGKSTFARTLKLRLSNACVIDQDDHAEFLNTYYRDLLPKQGPNTLKYSVTAAITDYAVSQTDLHLILCNGNRYLSGRRRLIRKYSRRDFCTVLVYFDIPKGTLEARVRNTNRSTVIFRSAATFKELLERQQRESATEEVSAPLDDEADYLFTVTGEKSFRSAISDIVGIAQSPLPET